jgi:2-octaprenylphenol hydroxylase
MNDVLVLGDGVIALSMALACVKKGYKVCLLSQREDAYTLKGHVQSPKVCAINRASEYLFKQLGVWADIQHRVFYDHMLVWDAFHQEELLFSAAECAEPNLGHIIPYESMRQALLQALHDQAVTMLDHQRFDAIEITYQAVTLSVADDVLKAKLCLGADGQDSWLRQQLGITSDHRAFGQQVIGAIIQHESPHFHTARQRFMPSGPLALLPLDDMHQSALVWSLDDVKAKRLMGLSPEAFEFELMAHYQGRMGPMTLFGKRLSFPIYAHHAHHYGVAGALILGDAAHTVHPLAGQGLNLGLMDVAVLIDLMQSHDLGAQVLAQAFTDQQRGYNERMRMSFTGFHEMFKLSHPLWARLRGLGMRALMAATPIKRKLCLQALGYRDPMPTCMMPLEAEEVEL